jgi:hypothetical protein
LADYRVQQHKVELASKHLTIRAYWTLENTQNSYNMRPMGENLDLAFKPNNQWFTDYANAFNDAFAQGNASGQSHIIARTAADMGRFEPGTAAFDQKLQELANINDWDVGAQIKMFNQMYHSEAVYDFADLIKPVEVMVGIDHRAFIIFPDLNHFCNPEPSKDIEDLFAYRKFGGFVQVGRGFFDNRLKLSGSLRVQKCDYFEPVLNPRLAAVFKATPTQSIRFSFQNGYRFPTLFEGFSAVNNGGVIRFGGLPVMSERFQLFENSYVRRSVDDFQRAVSRAVNSGTELNDAIIANQNLLVRNTYGYIQPEEINAFDLGYKGVLLGGKLLVDIEAYYNMYSNFIDQVEIAVPKSGTIGNLEDGVDSTIFQMENNANQVRYRMWTNSGGRYINLGASMGLTYNPTGDWLVSVNYTHAQLSRIEGRDVYLETSFNTPGHTTNLSIGNRNIYRNLGFNVAWRWQDAFEWVSPLADGTVPAYNSLDAQVTWRVPKIYSSFKLGATNLLNNYYTQYVGGPAVGGFYYLAITVDGIPLRKK